MGELVADNVLKTYQGKRVLVTGHTGFKGSWITLLLRSIGANIMGYALEPDYPNSHYELLGLKSKIHNVIGDVRDFEHLRAEVAKFQPDFVFHLAAQALVRSSYLDPKSTFDINVGGGINVLEVVRACNSVRALVFVTSDKCYENQEWIWGYRETDAMGGHDPYSASKGAIELIFSSYLRSFFFARSRFGAATARAGNVIGGGDWAVDRIVPDCVRSLRAGEPILIRSPKATRPWQHVLEPISGYLKLGASLYHDGKKYSGSWNFGPQVDKSHTVLDVANAIASKFVKGSVLVDEANLQSHEAHLLQLNSDKARQLLRWSTRWDFEQTLQATCEWYRDVLILGKEAEAVSRAQISKYYGVQL